MNCFKNLTRLGLATALLAGMGAAGAQSITIDSASVASTSGGTVAITVNFDPEGATVAGYSTVFGYPNGILTADPTITPGTASCTLDNALHTITVFRATFPAAAIPAETACTVNFPVAAGTAVATYPLPHNPGLPDTSFVDLLGVEIAPAGTVNDGAIDVIAEGPPDLSFDITPVALPAGGFGAVVNGTIPATLVTSAGPLTTSYVCVAPAGFSVAPANGNYTNASAGATDLTVSATLGAAPQGPADVVCTVTPEGGADVVFNIPVSAPAGAMVGPTLTPTPADGDTITVGSGAPGSNGTGSLVVTPSGGAGVDVSDITCVAVAPVTISGAFPVDFAVGSSSQSFTVSVPLTDAVQNFPGAITCDGTSAGAPFQWVFDVAAPAGVVPPTFVPASSLWSKLALFGIFAALGMLVLGLRRNH